MYQAVREPSPEVVQVVLVIDVPTDAVARTVDLVDEFGHVLAHLVPGVRAQGATVAPPRHQPGPGDRQPEAGLRIDAARRLIVVDGTPVRLAYREFELLAYLARQAGRTVSRAELMCEVWSDRPPGAPEDISERTVDTHITRLRGKLGDAARTVTTVRGRGYRFDADVGSGAERDRKGLHDGGREAGAEDCLPA